MSSHRWEDDLLPIRDLRRLPPLVWLLLLFVGSRLLYLLLTEPAQLIDLVGDELSLGMIAKELVRSSTQFI